MSGECEIRRERRLSDVSLHSSHLYPSTEYEKYLFKYFERSPLILGRSSTERTPSVSPKLVETWPHFVQLVDESRLKLMKASR
jgi:hypothetical protein